MFKRFIEWFKSRFSPIWQGVIIAIILIALLVVFIGCSSFAGDSASPQFGLKNEYFVLKEEC